MGHKMAGNAGSWMVVRQAGELKQAAEHTSSSAGNIGVCMAKVAKKKSAAGAKHAVKMSREGLPVDPREWTRSDWQDLHEAMERAKRAIAKRHAKDVG
jgi:hypothetical protein